MKKLLLETSFSKIYMIVMIIITLLILGGYFSYAMFTVTKEKENAISIVTGNLTYELLVDGEESNALTVPSNTVKDFTITLSNPNNIKARFNFYYLGYLPSNTKVGYITEEETNILPDEKGINLEKVDTTGSSNSYIIRVINNSGSSVTINLGVNVGLDYNDLSLPEDGHLFEEIISKGEVGTVILSNISKDNIYDDGYDTFTTGQYPNNYVWYSGKLWRAVSVNNEEKTVKLVTQWNISVINYDDDNSAFEGSYMEDWLNDTTADGFLGNLRDPDKFIVTDAVWDVTEDNRDLGSITRPDGTTTVTSSVGLLNLYEYQTSYIGSSASNGYLNNRLRWWTLTPYNSSSGRYVSEWGPTYNSNVVAPYGARPSINLKFSIKIVDGKGTEEDPYRLAEDNDINLSGTKLSSRYSGEYVSFGNGENNLYRIVSHETDGLTKITSAEPLKENGIFKNIAFGDDEYYSNTNMIGSFLNGEYLDSDSFFTEQQVNMIEDDTTWYLGHVASGASYKLSKYNDINMSDLTNSTTNTKVGLLRYGELMSGQFDRYGSNNDYFSLTPYSFKPNIGVIATNGLFRASSATTALGITPSLNLKSNVIITSGTGTKSDPFEIELG